jgi:hypothetical protein
LDSHTETRSGSHAVDADAYPKPRLCDMVRTSDFHQELTLAMSALLRVGTIVALENKGTGSPEVEPPLPRLALYGSQEYASSPDAALAKLRSPGFDFRRSVILETIPSPRPAPEGAAGAPAAKPAGSLRRAASHEPAPKSRGRVPLV